MRVIAIFAVFAIASVMVTCAVSVALTVRFIRRSNRVIPDRRSAAPTSWLWSWREPARLHRRLRRAVRMALAAVAPLQPEARGRHRPAPVSQLAGLAEDLTRRAAAIDDALVAAAYMRPLHPGLAHAVQDIEVGAYRLAGLAAAWRTQLHQSALSESATALDFGSRLDAFQAAMAELHRADSAR